MSVPSLSGSKVKSFTETEGHDELRQCFFGDVNSETHQMLFLSGVMSLLSFVESIYFMATSSFIIL